MAIMYGKILKKLVIVAVHMQCQLLFIWAAADDWYADNGNYVKK